MEDAAHCRHKPSSLSSPRTLVMKSIYLDFWFSPFSVTCQGGVTFGCDCLIVKKKKTRIKKKTTIKKKLHHNCKVKQPGVPLRQSCFRFFQKLKKLLHRRHEIQGHVSPPVYTRILIIKII